MRCDINVEDVEYNRPGGTPLLMRLYRPQGAGPFPIMVEPPPENAGCAG